MKFSIISMFLATVIITGFQDAHAALTNKSDGEWVTISGKVSDVTEDSFKLKADGKDILVEMDDYHWDADGYKLMNGDEVVVSGRIDQDFLEKKKVEAGSVYVKGLNSYFYANSADEEDPLYISTVYTIIPALPVGASVDLQGKVTKVDGREITVDTGVRKVKVDTKGLLFNPLDDVGFTKIRKGDRVRVSGRVDKDFFDSKEVNAAYITELK